MTTDLSPAPRHPDGEELKAYLDRELRPEDAAAVGRHVAECAECNAEVAAMRIIGEQVQSLGAAEPSAGFRGRVLAAIPFAPRRRLFALTGIWWADAIRLGSLAGASAV